MKSLGIYMAREQEFAWIVQSKLSLDEAINEGNFAIVSKIFQQCSLTIEDELINFGLNTKSLQLLFASIVTTTKKEHPQIEDENTIQALAKVQASYFLLDLFAFIHTSEEIVAMVVTAAIKRKAKGIPALREQNTLEQINHMIDHLFFWQNEQSGDEDTVEDQAKHTVCRALLAYFTLKSTEVEV